MIHGTNKFGKNGGNEMVKKEQCMKKRKILKKRSLALLLTFAILITMIPMAPLTVSAESNVVKVSKESDFGTQLDWDGIKPTGSVWEVHSGTYTLQNDVTLDYALYIPAGETVTIILNGYTLSRGLTKKAYSGSVIYNLGELTLGSEAVPKGDITGGYDAGSVNCQPFASCGGIVNGFDGIEATLTNYVRIHGNTGARGGGVSNINGTFTNYGIIESNIAKDGSRKGGGIYVYAGTVSNYGTVKNNTSVSTYSCGGGIAVDGGEFHNYGKIEANTAEDNGGGVYISAGTFKNYASGIIEKNKATKNGGGVFAGGTATFTNKGRINNNTAEGIGGGVYNMGGTFTNSGEIKGNEASQQAGGIFVNSSGTLEFKDGSIISGNKAGTYGGGIALTSGTMKLQSGKILINNNTAAEKADNVLLVGERMINIEGALTEGSFIGINRVESSSKYDTKTAGVVTSGYGTCVSGNELKYFFLDEVQLNGFGMILNGNKEIEIIEHTHSWNYEAGTGDDANKIYAWCTQSAPVCYYNGTGVSDAKLHLTLTDHGFDEELATFNAVTGNKSSTDAIVYYTDEGCTNKTNSAEHGASEEGKAPTKKGVYYATITISGKTAKVKFEITKLDQSATVTMSEYTYGEEVSTPTVLGAAEDPEVEFYYNTENTNTGGKKWTDMTATTLLPGTYYMYAVLEATDNYNSYTTAPTEFIVRAKSIASDVKADDVEKTYDGNSYGIEVTGSFPEGATIKYGTSEGNCSEDASPTYSDAGSYTVYYEVAATGYDTLKSSAKVVINKTQIVVKAEDKTMTTGEKLPELTVTYSGFINDETEDDIIDTKAVVSTTSDGKTEGSYPITFTTEASLKEAYKKNFELKHEEGTLTVRKAASSGGGFGGSTADSGNGSTSENYTIPVKNENTAEVKAEIKDGTANVSEITTDTIDKVINNKATESKVDTITIDLSGAKQEVTGVTFSKKSVETLAKATAEKDNGIETATIELSKATVVLDNKTLETLVEQAKGSQIELVVADTKQNNLNTAQQTTLKDYQVSTTFEAYFTSDGARIHDFNGGTAVVSIQFTPETGRDSSFYHLVYVADDGKLTRYKTKYQGGKLMFTTTHFSDYAVIYDTSEKNETDTEETPKEEQPKEEQPKEEEPKEEEKKDDGTGAEEKVTLDTTYRKLKLRVPATTKTTNVLKWTKVSDADGYVIYGNKCNTKGKTYKMLQQVVIKDNATTTWTDKNLAGGTYYKYCIKAYKLVDGKKVWLAKSKVVHSTTTGGKYGNAKSVKVNKTAVSLAVQKNFTIKAEQIVKDLPIKKHQEIKFESSNSKVASVTGKGVIKAKKKGTCYIYVYAQNGVYKKIKVTVK